MKPLSDSVEVGGQKLIFEAGHLAGQANAAVVCRLKETMVLATVVSASPREGIDYFPLFVEYQEKLYAGGKIKGSRWVKREGRPSDEAILAARLIDRSIRPLFPPGYRREVQVVVTVLSVDGENEPIIPAICATSAALSLSDIPWQGPIGAVRVGLKNGTPFINPTYGDLEFSEMDLVVSGSGEGVVMIEGEGEEVAEKVFFKGLRLAEKEIDQVIQLILKMKKKIGLPKQKVEKPKIDPSLKKAVEREIKPHLSGLLDQSLDFGEVKEILASQLEGEKAGQVHQMAEKVFEETVRKRILQKKRPDGRGPEDIRPLTIEVGYLPRTHGSAIFKRGQTQALTVTTLGSPSLEQWIESMTGEETKRYIHHYYMPPFSVGETGRFGWPSRREIGHGALAERALLPVIPPEEKFPYTIRVVSEILSSNGSTSMASVCGSSLSLMDAGVPIKKPVAGIALGLIKNSKEENEVILTDITGLEDGCGDMDCKLAGTGEGITAIQMDVKTPLDLSLFEKVLKRGHQARLFILEKMAQALPAPREEISQYAPKIAILHVEPSQIGEVIGPGGKTIRKIIEETNTAIDVDDDGTVTISGKDPDQVGKASRWINGLTRRLKIGEVFEGEVKRIKPFGVFVEIFPGREGLVHISKMAPYYVKDPRDLVKPGQKIKVKVIEIDERNRINLSMILDERRSR